MPATLTILHATDLHLRRHLPGSSGHAVRRSREIPHLLARLADVVRERRPDLLALTGDLVDVPHTILHGTGDEHPEMMAEAVADYALLRHWLDQLPCPWQLVPGNHDHPAAFDRVFAPGRSVERSLKGFRIVGFDDWEVEANQAQRVGDARARFERVLADKDPAPQVHLQHYLVRPEVDYRYPLMYREAAALAEATERSGKVRAVLCGHWHKGELPLTVDGTTYSVCPTFCEWPHRFRMVSLDPGGTRVETLALDGAGARDRRGAAFLGLDRLIAGDLSPDEAPQLGPQAEALLRSVSAEGRLPLLVFPWQPQRHGWRSAQAMADALARAARAFGSELDAAYFVVPVDLDGAGRDRLPAEGAPQPAQLFAMAERDLGIDLARSVLAGGGDPLAAAARDHGVRPLPSFDQ